MELKDLAEGDTINCAVCGKECEVTAFIDISNRRGYECECGHSESEHIDDCECPDCEANRAQPALETREELIEKLTEIGWNLKFAKSTNTIYAYGTVNEKSYEVRISDHAASVFRNEQFGAPNVNIVVSNDWLEALNEMPDLDQEDDDLVSVRRLF